MTLFFKNLTRSTSWRLKKA